MGCALNLESYYEHQRDWSFFEEKHRTEYKYDPLGRRIMRQVVDNVDPQKSSLKKYYYDGVNIIAELDAVDNLTASYTYSPLRADDILGAKFTSYATGDSAISEGQILSQTAGAVYYLKDHLNTINEIVNDAGDIIQKMDYSAYGVLRSVKDSGGHELGFGNAPVRTSFSYTGREFEPELNIYYYRARYYDPSTGRFLQQDPEPGKLASPNTFLSKYVYAVNSPVMFSDPSGREPVTAIILFASVLSGLIAGSISYNDARKNGVSNNQAYLSGILNGIVTGIAVWASLASGSWVAKIMPAGWKTYATTAMLDGLIWGSASYINNVTNQLIKYDGNIDRINWGRASASFGVGAIGGMLFSFWGQTGKPFQALDILTNEFGALNGYCYDAGFGSDDDYSLYCGIKTSNPPPIYGGGRPSELMPYGY